MISLTCKKKYKKKKKKIANIQLDIFSNSWQLRQPEAKLIKEITGTSKYHHGGGIGGYNLL